MPAVLLRTASKQIQAGFQAARHNFSFERPTTPRPRGESFSGDREFSDKESDDEEQRNRNNSNLSSRRKSFQNFLKSPASPLRTPRRQSSQPSSIFRSRASSISGESAASRIKSFFRIAKNKDSSETFSTNSGATPSKSSLPDRQNKVSQSVIFHRKQSDISNISGSCDEAEGSGQESSDAKPLSKRRHRSRVPAVIENSVSAMLDSQTQRHDATADIPDA